MSGAAIAPGGGGPWRLDPGNGRLTAAAAGAAVLVTAGPLLLLGTAAHILLAAGALIAAAAVLFSTRRTLAALLVVTAVLPVTVADLVRLPMGVRPWELILLAGCLFAAIDLVTVRGLRVRRTALDGLMLAFLAAAALAVVVGELRGNEATLRNARYAFYYLAFFLVVQAVPRRDVTRLFLPLLVLSGAVISVEYLLEFLGAIDLSTGESFVRVSRRQGVMLPVSMLVLANWFVHQPRRWGRPALVGLFLLTGLAFAITVGRGMWAAFGVGLLVTVWLWHRGQPARQRRAWKAVALTVGLLLTLAASVLAFQRVTGAAISAHAVERSRTFIDFGRDVQVLSRLLNYATALQEIAKHPVLGAGQGAAVTSYSFNPDSMRFETWRAWTLDSLYLTLWLKMGLAGLLLFLWLCLRTVRRALAVFHRSRDPGERAFAAAAVAVLAGMALLGLSDGSMVNGRFAAVFAILIGLVMVLDTEAQGKQTQ